MLIFLQKYVKNYSSPTLAHLFFIPFRFFYIFSTFSAKNLLTTKLVTFPYYQPHS